MLPKQEQNLGKEKCHAVPMLMFSLDPFVSKRSGTLNQNNTLFEYIGEIIVVFTQQTLQEVLKIVACYSSLCMNGFKYYTNVQYITTNC